MGINIYQNGGANPSVDFVDDLTAKTLLSVKQHGTLVGDLGSVVTQYDDFLGKAITGLWDVQKGSDAATVNFAVSANTSGMVRATTGAGAGASMAANGVQLSSGLNWKANQGNLVFEAKVKISTITNINVYVGLTDQLSALEAPVTLSGTTFTTNATDAVGFLFDTNATTDTIRCVGVANDVDATMQDTSLAYVAATYKTFRIELTTSGVATFFIDGVQVGTAMTGAVTPTIALTPVVAGFTESAASATIDVDYILVQQTR